MPHTAGYLTCLTLLALECGGDRPPSSDAKRAPATRSGGPALTGAGATFPEPTLKSVAAAAAGAELPPNTDFRVSITSAPGQDSYPIASFTWLLIRKEDPDTARAKTIHEFVAGMLEPAAQRMAADLHYAPLPVPVIELVRQSRAVDT